MNEREAEPSQELTKALKSILTLPRDNRRVVVDHLADLRAENARLQRVVDDLTEALRKANARLVNIARLAQQDEPDPQEIYNEAYSGEVRKALERHGLLRDCDRPEMVPSAMRAEVD